tara:strand:- start:5259 stop:5681 length:423 start_codon:yes stop_codon:yes gene_type:complete
MRIYIKNLNLLKVPDKDLNPFYLNSSYEELIYSLDGIFKYTNNKLKRLHINDVDVVEDYLDNYNIIIDNSLTRYESEYYQIPLEYVIQKREIRRYGMNKRSSVFMIINIDDNKISDIFFETETSPNLVKEDIITFLSLLK